MAILAVLPAPGHASPTTQATFTVYNVSLTVTPSVVVSNFLPVSGLVPIAANVTALSPTGVYPQSCALGAYTPANSQTCTLCHLLHHAGLWLQPGLYGTYSASPGASSPSACLTCPANTYFWGTGEISPSNCTARPANSSSVQPYMIHMKSDCICNPGFAGPAGTSSPLF